MRDNLLEVVVLLGTMALNARRTSATVALLSSL